MIEDGLESTNKILRYNFQDSAQFLFTWGLEEAVPSNAQDAPGPTPILLTGQWFKAKAGGNDASYTLWCQGHT